MGATFRNRMVAIVATLAIAAVVPALAGRPREAAAGPGASQQAVGTAAQAAAVRYWTGRRMTRNLVRQPPQAVSSWLNGDTGGAGLRWTHGGPVAAAVGRIFFTLGRADYVCSGALVGGPHPDVVLTAAHCVSDGPGRGRATRWATNWVFVPGFTDGRLPYGEYTARRFLVPPGWTAPGGAEPDDFAFVQVNAAKSPPKLPYGLAVEFGRRPDVTSLRRSYVFGYPAEPPYAGLYPAYCAGPVTASGGSVRMPCGMTAGDSGGPWLDGFRPRSGRGQVAAVTTYKMSGNLAVLYGAVLGPRARALYQRAVRSAR